MRKRISTNVYRGLLDAGVTSVAINNGCDNGRLKGIKRLDSDNGSVKSHSFGPGFAGTGSGNEPRYSRTRDGNVIKTTIMIDLNAKQQKGDATGDVIGISGEGDAYIYKNVVAENGIIFRQELSCLETAAVGSGTTDKDFDIVWAGSGALAFDGAAGAGSILNAGVLAAGQTVVHNTPAITADHYCYFVEGGTVSGSANAVFNAGQYMLTLYGAALIPDDVSL